MKILQEKVDRVTVITISGEVLDASIVGDFKTEIAPILKQESNVILDLNQIQFVDSSGIGAILSCLRILNAEGGELRICSLTKPVQALFELVRMHKIFAIFSSRELALESFR